VYCFVVAGVVCFGFWILRVCVLFFVNPLGGSFLPGNSWDCVNHDVVSMRKEDRSRFTATPSAIFDTRQMHLSNLGGSHPEVLIFARRGW